MKNKFSIITVVKNDKSNILTTLSSVKNQNYSNYEHLVLDGNSSDGTSEIIKKNLNKKIKYFCQKDKSLYDAINKGIFKSTGDYVFLLHSGDFFYNSEVINKINSNLVKNEDFLYGNLVYHKNFIINRIWRFSSEKLNHYNTFKIAHPTLTIKRKILKKIKYNKDFKISSDTDFLIRLLKIKKLKYKKLDEYFIFMISGGLSTSLANLILKIREDVAIYYKHFNYIGILIYFYKILKKFNSLVVNKRNRKKLRFELIREYKKLQK
jgi:glycosyltransferase